MKYTQIPNLLTTLRAVLTLIIIVIASFDFAYRWWIVLGLFLIASVTDFLDGYLARRWNCVSSFGAIADALIDKVLILSLLIFLASYHVVLPGVVAGILVRELIVDGLKNYLLSIGTAVPAKFWGKVKVNTQILLIAWGLVFLAQEQEPSQIFFVYSLGVLALTWLSGWPYLKTFWRHQS